MIAKLAQATYPVPQQVQVTLVGTSSQLDLSLLTPSAWIAQGTTVTLSLSARVLSNGSPVTGSTVNYQITQGAATLSNAAAQTDASGNASVNLQVNSLSALIQVRVCVAPNNSPCQIFGANVVPASSFQVQAVAGTLQIVPAGQSFQPVMVRVTDSSSPPNPVLGSSVLFLSSVGRLPQNQPIVWAGESSISQPITPIVVGKSQSTVQSHINGLASVPLSTGGISGNVAVVGSATTGTSSVQYEAPAGAVKMALRVAAERSETPFVPEGRLPIARRFNAGFEHGDKSVGTAEHLQV